MSCCSKMRAQFRPVDPRAVATPVPAGRAPNPTYFEYTGSTVLTAVGGMTGRAYRFAGRGARVLVDPRDRWSMLRVPALRELSPGSEIRVS
jgi:hypothetical protein